MLLWTEWQLQSIDVSFLCTWYFFFLCLAVLICGYFDVQLWFQGFTPLNHCISQLYCKNQDWYFFWYFTHLHLIFFVINQAECSFDIPISFLSFFWIWKTTCMFAHGKWTCQSWCSPFIFFFKCGVKVVHIAWNILDRPSLFFFSVISSFVKVC